MVHVASCISVKGCFHVLTYDLMVSRRQPYSCASTLVFYLDKLKFLALH
jgi:hypothetical protein